MKKVRVLVGGLAVILPLAAAVLLSNGSKQAEIVPVKPEGITIQITVSI